MTTKQNLFLTAALLAVAAKFAHGDTITFGSYGGTTPTTGLSNSAVHYDNTTATNGSSAATSLLPSTGTAYAYNLAAYGNPAIAGTSFVSYDPTTTLGLDSSGLTTYTTTYTGNLAGYTGSLSMLGDDSIAAFLNGTLLGTSGSSSYDTLVNLNIASGLYVNGVNTFKFVVLNTGGATGLDFKATATSPAIVATPEPSSMVLLGTALLGMAFFFRKRILA